MTIQEVSTRIVALEREIRLSRFCLLSTPDHLSTPALYRFRQAHLISLLQELATLQGEYTRLRIEHMETHYALHKMKIPHTCKGGKFYLIFK